MHLQYDATTQFHSSLSRTASQGQGWAGAAADALRGATGTSSPSISGGKFPYGLANIAGLVSRQKYDVIVELVLPRSEKNLAAGNWMVALEMRGPGTVGGGVTGMLGWDEEWEVDDFSTAGVGREKESTSPDADSSQEGTERGPTESGNVKDTVVEKPHILARSRRPALLTYRHWTTELAYRLLRLPLYVLNFHTESETLAIQMMEGVEFDKGWRNVPSSVRLEMRAAHPLDVYKVSVRVAARLEGLRWIMWNYRISTAVVFIGLFWAMEMGMLLGTWGIALLLLSGSGDEIKQEDTGSRRIKQESEGYGGDGAMTPKEEHDTDNYPPTPLSETERTFPTLSSQRPLHYSSPGSPGEQPSEAATAFVDKIKRERSTTPRVEDVPPARTEGEADDEDDDFVQEDYRDSGIGTGRESTREGEVTRRRSNRSLKER